MKHTNKYLEKLNPIVKRKIKSHNFKNNKLYLTNLSGTKFRV